MISLHTYLHYCHSRYVPIVYIHRIDTDEVIHGGRGSVDLHGAVVASGDDLVPVPLEYADGFIVGRDTVIQQAVVPYQAQGAVHLTCNDPFGVGGGGGGLGTEKKRYH